MGPVRLSRPVSPPERFKGVTQDIEEMGFNTAISKLMVFVRDITREGPTPRPSAEAFVMMLSPFAPHVAEELWEIAWAWTECGASTVADL